MKIQFLLAACLSASLFAGCATVPTYSDGESTVTKEFKTPVDKNMAGLYVYREEGIGTALKKDLYIDGICLGESANGVFFYKEITPGKHTLSTESEFSDNSLDFNADAGSNYYFQQYIKFGMFVGGANLEQKTEEEAQSAIMKLQQAIPGTCDNLPSLSN